MALLANDDDQPSQAVVAAKAESMPGSLPALGNTPDKNCKAGSNGSVGTSIDIPDIGDIASTPLSQDM
jgi:hypothetical protein